MTWLLTLTGRRFELGSPEAYDYDLEEIATSLSRINRFAGHTLGAAYSVAQHSVHVLHETLAILEPPTRAEAPYGPEAEVARRATFDGGSALLAALLHDASEAFLVDLPAPIKRLEGMLRYRALEADTQAAIERRFFSRSPAPWVRSIVKVADLALLRVEHDALLPQGPHGAEYLRDLPQPARALLRSEVTPWPAERARAEFVRAFEWIGGVILPPITEAHEAAPEAP